jgi:hypothetical protein
MNLFGYEFKKASLKAKAPQQQGRMDLLGGIGSAAASWIGYGSDLEYLAAFDRNPVLRAIIELKAKAKSNLIFKIWDEKAENYINLSKTRRPDLLNIINILSKPNPLQSYSEWQLLSEVNYSIFGNSYDYATLPDGFLDVNYQTITSIRQLPPYLMGYVLTGRYFDQTTIEGIIEKYVLQLPTGQKDILPAQIFHRNDVNITFDQNFIKGVSKLQGLTMPLTNIEKAFESRNVIIRKRGALGMFTSDNKDGAGSTYPLLDNQMEQVQKDLEKYGALDDQWQYMFLRYPMSYHKTSLNMDELKLFEEVSADAMLVCNAFGVPEVLLKLYLEGATFENQEASERRLYQSTIIPETSNQMDYLNRWLKTHDGGIRLDATFDHIPVLQANKKDEALTKKENSAYLEKLWMQGAITHNEWLLGIGLPKYAGGDVRIWDLTEEQLKVIQKTAAPKEVTEPTQTPEDDGNSTS